MLDITCMNMVINTCSLLYFKKLKHKIMHNIWCRISSFNTCSSFFFFQRTWPWSSAQNYRKRKLGWRRILKRCPVYKLTVLQKNKSGLSTNAFLLHQKLQPKLIRIQNSKTQPSLPGVLQEGGPDSSSGMWCLSW